MRRTLIAGLLILALLFTISPYGSIQLPDTQEVVLAGVTYNTTFTITQWQHVEANDSLTAWKINESIGINVVHILFYNNSTQAFDMLYNGNTNNTFGTVRNVAKGEGYLVRMAANNSSELDNTSSAASFWNLSTGWNLLGHSANETKTLEEINGSINSSSLTYLVYRNWTNTSEHVYTRGSDTENLTQVPQGKAFWAYVTGAVGKTKSW